MKKRRLLKFTAVIIALLLLVSCASQDAGSSSSSAAQNENHSAISSEAPKKETSSNPATTDKEKVPSKQPQKEQTTSKPDFERPISSDKETSSNDSEEIDIEQRRYVMLPDNPAPVKVNRPDAATPTPISYTNMIYDENTIPFESQSIRGHGNIFASDNENMDRYIAIVDTYEEYKTLFKNEYSKYNQEYFNNKAVIMLYIIDGTYDSKQEIVSVSQFDGRMYIYLKNVCIGGGYAMDYACMFIGVSKSALKEIEDIVVYEEKIPQKTADGLYHIEYIHREEGIQA